MEEQLKAVVWHGVGDVRLDEVADPQVREPTDAIVEITTSALCGTDLHFARGTMSGMVAGTVLGHEAVGVVREVGEGVRNKSLTVKLGNCNHRRYIPRLLDRVRTGAIDPSTVLTQTQGLTLVLEAYESFDRRESGWTKVSLDPRR